MTQGQDSSTTLPGTRAVEDATSTLAPVTSEHATPAPQDPGAIVAGLVARVTRNENLKVGPFEPPRCGGMGKDGQPCTQLRVLKTANGWRCRHHREGGAGKRRPPVKVLKTLDDVVRLASWAALAAARGEMTATDAHAIGAICREWRMAFSDAHSMGRFNALEKQIAELARRA